MARIRSPGYPSFSLEQAIEMARKVHSQDRQHPVDRATAARHIGFSGLSGASDRALSALMHYGLMDKAQKGEMRVTDLALRILHPNHHEERQAALDEAAFSPDLFKELRGRYPDAPPSKDGLSSYLLRSGFASAAIPTATKAYLETCYFLQREQAYDLGVAEPEQAPEPQALEPESEFRMHSTHANVGPAPEPPAAPAARTIYNLGRHLEPNEVYLDIKGSREVHIEGILDYDGILDLEEKIKALKLILKKPDRRAEPHQSERNMHFQTPEDDLAN